MNKHITQSQAYSLHDHPRTSQYVILSLRYWDIFSHLSLLVTSSLHMSPLARMLMWDISDSLSYILTFTTKGYFLANTFSTANTTTFQKFPD